MEEDFRVSALESALRWHGRPEIFNTDQDSQFTDDTFTGVLKDAEVAIGMDGKGRAMDNIMVERLWRSVKYEEIYLKDYRSVAELIEVDNACGATATDFSYLKFGGMLSLRRSPL